MSIGYGYVEVGICNRCGMPDHLFVLSSYGVDQNPRCYGCSTRFTDMIIEKPDVMAESPNCEACGRPESDEDSRWQLVNGYLADKETEITVHQDCSTLSRHFAGCNDCGTIYATVKNVDWYRVADNNFEFTTFTLIEGQNRCDACANTFFEDNGGRRLYQQCSCCDDTFRTTNGLVYRNTIYCRNCHGSYVYECDDCSAQYWDGDDHDCDESDDTIHSYSYRPRPYFFGEGQYHLGFELEVESRNSSSSRYGGAVIAQGELGSHAYMKDDGSLNDGFEVVTHPHTLEQYQTNFNWDFIARLKDDGFRSWNTDTCGLHVHVSRTAFGEGEIDWNSPIKERDRLILRKQAHELRFMKLIYDNQRQVERIAGRSNNHFATFSDKGRLMDKVKFGTQNNVRYSAINTDNDATLEVRVFKGSLRKERVLSALEFVAASVEYTRDLKVTSQNQALSWLRFTAYVSDNIETYPSLALIMSESFASDNTPYEN